ncbi:MAG: DUF1549 domain-containing protein [Planctomycetaceae bacterium]|nr:DUF1549 domain-containing protein [Planctomycetaceae bacterium]
MSSVDWIARHFRLVRCAGLACLLAGLNSVVFADEPPAAPSPATTPPTLAAEIDALVDAGQLVPLAGPATDAEFMRRATIDLNGRVPTGADVQAFLADPAPDKRARLVDQLLSRPEFVRVLAQWLDVTLMERRPDKNVPSAEWQAYLYASAKANKPFDQLAREILSAETGEQPDPALRPASKFYLDRDAEPNLLTRDVARIFFGKDFQCNQCHDHPLVADYLQADYYGLFACFQRTTLFTDKEKKVWLAEKADGEPTYQSVFVPGDTPHPATPRLPDGPLLTEPAIAAGQEYLVAPADNVRPVPRHSRRALLAQFATDGTNPAVARNLANRLWAHMLGRGLVEPVDMHHSHNPPSNPELLELLAQRIASLKFDMRVFLRQIALSRAYQRSIDLPTDLPDRTGDVASQLPALEEDLASKQAAFESMRQAAQQAESAHLQTQSKTEPLFAELRKVQGAMNEAQQNAVAATNALNAAQADLAAKQDLANTLATATTAAQAAAARLAGEAELAAAAEKFRVRSEQAAADATAAMAIVAQKQSEATAAAAKATALQPALAAAGDAVAPARQERAAAQALAEASTSQMRQARLVAQVAAQRRQEALALLSYRDAVAQLSQAQARLDQAVSEVAAAEAPVVQRISATATQTAEAERALAVSEESTAGAASAVSTSEQQLAESQAAGDALAEALAKATVARDKLPADTELAQAVSLLAAGAERTKTAHAALTQQRDAAQQVLAQAQTEVAAARQAVAARQAELAALEAERAKLAEPRTLAQEAAATAQQQVAVAEQEVIDKLQPRVAVAALKALSPEALAWSMLQVTGVLDATRAAVEAEWLAAHPGVDVAQLDAAQQQTRAFEIEQGLYEKLKGVPQQFVGFYAAAPGQPQNAFQATVDQALFLANNGALKSWLAPSGQNLTARLVALGDPQQLADELYLSVLNRQPLPEEAAEVAALLAAQPNERPQVVAELAWSLICSSEFRFNH